MEIDILATHGSTSLRPGGKVKLNCKDATQWGLDPPTSPGTIDNAGNYTAPEVIPNKQNVTVVATDASGGKKGQWTIKLHPIDKYARFGQFLTEDVMVLGSAIMAVALFIVLIVSLTEGAQIYNDLRDPAYARGVITFLIVAAAISFGLILVLHSIYGKEDEKGERFRRGREVHSVLVGVMGTIVGFYFGTTGRQAVELNVAAVQIVDTTNYWKHLSTYVSGGEKPYQYAVYFDPQPTNGPANVTNALSEPGWIIYDFPWPTNVTKTVNVTVAVTDKNERKKTANGSIREQSEAAKPPSP